MWASSSTDRYSMQLRQMISHSFAPFVWLAVLLALVWKIWSDQQSKEIFAYRLVGNVAINTISGGICWAMRVRTNFNTSSLLSTSQIPSQASKINSQLSVIVFTITSGAARRKTTMLFVVSHTRPSISTGNDLFFRSFVRISFENEISESSR